MRVYLVRHGESLATLDPTLFGRMDPRKVPLSVWGYEQTRDVGEFFRKRYTQDGHYIGKKLRFFYSPHLRIVQSKDGIIETLGKDLVAGATEDEALREREHGEFDGLDEAAQQKRSPEIFAKLHSEQSELRYKTRMPGGESVEDVALRLNDFMDRILAHPHPDEDIVIVTHGGNCRSLEDHHFSPNAVWLENEAIPKTGDVIEIYKDTGSELKAKCVLEGKKRLPGMKNYKTEAYGVGAALRT